MTDQEINEAIARKCGLKVKDVPIVPAFIDLHHNYLTDKAFREYRKAYPFGSIPMRVPNYCTDLNAMHEAEKTLSEKMQVWYLQKLTQVRYKDGVSGMIACMIDKTTFATARQRAEAFLRVFGLWKE